MNVIIVGGVAAGMSCAARLRRLDESATITVLEKGSDISVASCGLPYYVGGEIEREEQLRVQTPASLTASLNIDIRVNTEAIAIDSSVQTVRARSSGQEFDLSYDALVLAPGARKIVLPVPGGDSPSIAYLRSIEDAIAVKARAIPGQRAIVVGAGFIGLEAAESLRRVGMDVTLIEGSAHVLPPLDEEMSTLVLKELQTLGITVMENVGVTGFETEGDVTRVQTKTGEVIEAELVLVAAGARTRVELAESAGIETENGAIVVDDFGRTSNPRIWAAGDAVISTSVVTGARRPVQLAGPASRAGRRIADAIAVEVGAFPLEPRPIADPEGTAIIRVGGLGVAMTGANADALKRAGIDFMTARLHHNQHVGYMPGATNIALHVHYGPDGSLYGAQAIAKEGADRKIDVFATAIRAGLKIQDLIDIDFAYAPPFGAPKDLVNMAGMVGENVLTGMIKEWSPADLPEITKSHLVLDVRRVDEYEAGPRIPGALNVPHTWLRDRMDEVLDVAQGRPVAVHCRSGVRSYLAYRMLEARGVDVTALSGGMLSLEAWAYRHQELLDY